jgi:hypothetical protein
VPRGGGHAVVAGVVGCIQVEIAVGACHSGASWVG